MARKIKISASALNIRLHPHTPTRYAEWLDLIFARRIIAQVHGDRYGMISTLDRSETNRGIVSGVITTFVKFDDGGHWFNAESLSEATDDVISQVQIPRNLYPNSSTFYFYFDTNKHRLYFQTYSEGKTFTPNSAYRFFGALSRDIEVMARFKEAKISIVQDKASIDRLFGIKKINEIHITIQKPNTDIFDDNFEQKIENHLEETHSRQISIIYKAEPGSSIVATDDIKNLSSVALENGNIRVIGRDERGAVTLNSDSFPEERHDKFDPELQSERVAFFRLVSTEESKN